MIWFLGVLGNLCSDRLQPTSDSLQPTSNGLLVASLLLVAMPFATGSVLV